MRSPAPLLALGIPLVVLAGCAAHATERDAGFHRIARAFGASPTADGCLDGDAGCAALRDNIARDNRATCTPDARDVFTRPLARPTRIAGELAYVGLDPREYTYDLFPDAEGAYHVDVRVQFEGALAQDHRVVAAMQRKMNAAAGLWTSRSPGGRVTFRFVAQTTDAQAPHFQVHLAPGDGRTPFDVTWGAEWSWHLIAHEIGHMMGLDDEYGQLRKTLGHVVGMESTWARDPNAKRAWFRCDLSSLMCDSKGEQSLPQEYHYYVILRRRFCDVVPSLSVF